MEVSLVDAIAQLRSQLRQAVLDRDGEDIVLTPQSIELELAIKFKAEATVKGGFKLFALLDLSAEGKAGTESSHKVKFTLLATDADGKPLKISRDKLPAPFKKRPKDEEDDDDR